METGRQFVAITLGCLITIGLLIFGMQYVNTKYVNLVWGRVESVRYSKEYDTDEVSILYSVDKEPYTGTYRVVIRTDDFYYEDDVVLLMTDSMYSRALIYDAKNFSGDDVATFDPVKGFVTACKIVAIVLACCSVAFIIGFLGYKLGRKIWLKLNRYASSEYLLDNCVCVSSDNASKLMSGLDSMRQLKRKCSNKSLNSMLNRVLNQMYKRIAHIYDIDKVTVKETETDTKTFIDDTVNTFKVITDLAAEQVYKSTLDGYNSDEFKHALYQLEAYAEL